MSPEALTYYKDELRVARTMNCLQRVRDLALTTNISLSDKADLANMLVQLIKVREGDYRELKWYQYQRENSPFFRLRMNLVEPLLDERYENITDEQVLKSKVLTITKKYEKE